MPTIEFEYHGKKIEVYMRLREHAYFEEKQVSEEYGDSVRSIAETPQEATLQSCSCWGEGDAS